MKRKRSIITRAIVLLIAGAIVDVAVAWGCASLMQIQPAGFTPSEEMQRLWNAHAPSDLQAPTHQDSMLIGVGVDVRGCALYADGVRTASVSESRAGLPMRSLVGGAFHAARQRHLRGAWTASLGPRPWRERLIPLRPLWPGFAINAIFYAAILWLLFAAPGFVRKRRRIKRGLCPACAYPVGASDVCTECGARVKGVST